jgi:aspartyl-tRNA(Asn)/glutamyl-tRNA(Gln) amidotransferase subunit A
MPLRGIPLALKANYDCAGVPSSAGSLILSDHVPGADAETVGLLRRSGAVVVGMTNMNEFADGPTGHNPHYGNATNPWDRTRMPGGSSSGSAVALALDMCLGATGSDTGGSIRTPSAFCGTVGLKPTYGLVRTAGIFPFSRTLDHAGPMGRTVDDVRLLLGAMTGGPRSPERPRPAVSAAGPLAGLTVGIDTHYFTRVLEPAVRESFEGAVARIEQLGAAVRSVALTAVDSALPALVAILFPEAALVHEQWLVERAEDYGEEVRDNLMSGRRRTALEYLHALETRAAIRHEIDAALEQVDVLLTPTAVISAPTWDQDGFRVEGQKLDSLDAFIRCTAPFNLSGHPVVSVPAGLTAAGMPTGLQFVAAHGAEELLLDAAEAFERHAMDGRLVPPPGAV